MSSFVPMKQIDQKVSSAYATANKKIEYITDPERLDKLFYLIHPNFNSTLTWKEVEGLSADTLKIICESVVHELYMNKNLTTFEYNYVKEPLEPEDQNKSHRILKSEILGLECNSLVTATVAKCVYKHDTFYLARASSEAVFVLRRDGQIFRLDSGLYKIRLK